jgi:hypothetical protein
MLSDIVSESRDRGDLPTMTRTARRWRAIAARFALGMRGGLGNHAQMNRKMLIYSLLLGVAAFAVYRLGFYDEKLADRRATPRDAGASDADEPPTAPSSPSQPAFRPPSHSGKKDPSADKPGRIAGAVRRSHDWRPVASVEVAFSRLGSAFTRHAGTVRERFAALTDRNGRYAVSLRPGIYDVVLRGKTIVTRRELLFVEPNARVDRLHFSVDQLTTVRGQTLSLVGKPQVGLEIRVHRERGPSSRHALSRVQGLFELAIPPNGAMLSAHQKGVSTLTPTLFSVPGSKLIGLQIRLGAGGQLRGQVTGPGGQLVSGGRVVMQDAAPGRRGRIEIACDDQGRFALAGLSAGRRLLQGIAKGYAPGQVQSVLLSPNTRRQVVLRAAQQKTIEGRVIGGRRAAGIGEVEITAQPAGSREKGAVAWLFDPIRTRSGVDGRFRLPGVGVLPVTLLARGPKGRFGRRFGVAGGSREVQLRLMETGGLVGRVTDGKSGKPLAVFSLELEGQDGLRRRVWVASADGRFRLPSLPAGRSTVWIRADGYAARKSELSLVQGSDVQLSAVLDRGGRIVGKLVDHRAVALPGARVTLVGLNLTATTNVEGRFVLRDVPRGVQVLEASHPAFQKSRVDSISVFARRATALKRVVQLTVAPDKRDLVPKLGGLGLSLAMQKRRLVVTQVAPGSPAKAAGINVGDIIDNVDGSPLSGMTLELAQTLMRGLDGTAARLVIARGDKKLNLSVLRSAAFK